MRSSRFESGFFFLVLVSISDSALAHAPTRVIGSIRPQGFVFVEAFVKESAAAEIITIGRPHTFIHSTRHLQAGRRAQWFLQEIANAGQSGEARSIDLAAAHLIQMGSGEFGYLNIHRWNARAIGERFPEQWLRLTLDPFGGSGMDKSSGVLLVESGPIFGWPAGLGVGKLAEKVFLIRGEGGPLHRRKRKVAKAKAGEVTATYLTKTGIIKQRVFPAALLLDLAFPFVAQIEAEQLGLRSKVPGFVVAQEPLTDYSPVENSERSKRTLIKFIRGVQRYQH